MAKHHPAPRGKAVSAPETNECRPERPRSQRGDPLDPALGRLSPRNGRHGSSPVNGVILAATGMFPCASREVPSALEECFLGAPSGLPRRFRDAPSARGGCFLAALGMFPCASRDVPLGLEGCSLAAAGMFPRRSRDVPSEGEGSSLEGQWMFPRRRNDGFLRVKRPFLSSEGRKRPPHAQDGARAMTVIRNPQSAIR